MDVRGSGGLGTGNRDQQMQRYLVLAQKQEQILQVGGMQNPLVTLKNYYNTLEKLVEAADLSDVDLFFSDPDQNPMPPQAPQMDPKVLAEQAKQQVEMQKMQAKAQLDAQKMQAEAQVEAQKMQVETEMAAQKMQVDQAMAERKVVAEMELAERVAAQKTQAEAEQFERRIAQEREIAIMQLEADARKAEQDHALAMERIVMEERMRERELAIETELEKVKMAAGVRSGQGDLNLSD